MPNAKLVRLHEKRPVMIWYRLGEPLYALLSNLGWLLKKTCTAWRGQLFSTIVAVLVFKLYIIFAFFYYISRFSICTLHLNAQTSSVALFSVRPRGGALRQPIMQRGEIIYRCGNFARFAM